MTDTATLDKLTSWLTDPGDFIGVFECEALDSSFLGTRIAVPFASDQWERAVVGRTTAPDSVTFKHGYGAGWKFILKGKFMDPVAAAEGIEEGLWP
jgi:hypothetical protein